MVRIFDVPVLSVASSVSYLSSFSDMSGHPSANAVATLASLGIVSTTAPKFYPDNYLRHYDFVLLLVNSLLVANNQTLTPSLYSPFADVESSASYLSQLTYARDHGFVDSLIGTK
ncbi:MAG: S-layer homology domain-containing protein [bacterium]